MRASSSLAFAALLASASFGCSVDLDAIRARDAAASSDLGIADLGDLGRVDLGRADLGRTDLGNLDLGDVDLGVDDGGVIPADGSTPTPCVLDAECELSGAVNQRARCTDDVCVYTCEGAFVDCNDNRADGCETTLVSLTDCGSCGTPCTVANGVASCATGTCAIGSCAAGYTDCDTLVSTGCEVHTSIDPAQCGSCTTSCAAPAATTACVDSACVIVSCAAGRSDCDAVASNGCETDTTLFANCGACGNSCTLRGTMRECSASTCVSLGCEAGYTDCSAGVPGCEAFLASDRNNCGSCGRVCGGGESCTNGGCCPTGQDFCPGVGCVNTANNTGHCGRCFNLCGAGLRCFDYECVP